MEVSTSQIGKATEKQATGLSAGILSFLRSLYGRFLVTILGLRHWRSREELIALALHLEHEVFPLLREHDVATLEIEVSPDGYAPLCSATEGAPDTFPGTERLHGQLRTLGLQRLRLCTKLESGQVVECVLLFLFSGRAQANAVAPIPHYEGWQQSRIAAAMQSPEGYHKFCARMTYDPKSGNFEARYTYCELGVTRAVAKYVRRNNRFRDHRALFYAAPRFALLAVLLLAFPLVLFYWQPELFVAAYILLILAISGASAVAIYTLGAYEYGREHQELLLKSHMDQVRTMIREREAQNVLLEKTNALKDMLLQVGAHDIRSPLVNIMLRAETQLVKAEKNPALPDEAWRSILMEADRIRGIVDNFLNLQRIQQGKLQTQCDPFEINAVISKVVASRELELKHRKMAVKHDTNNTLSLALGDHICIAEVLQNYVGNAIKFSPEGSSLIIRTQARDAHIRVEVADAGPGIPKEEHQYLFQEFAEISNRPLNGETSTGLGLAIVRKLVESQQGHVGAEFPEGGGSIFWFEVPAYRT